MSRLLYQFGPILAGHYIQHKLLTKVAAHHGPPGTGRDHGHTIHALMQCKLCLPTAEPSTGVMQLDTTCESSEGFSGAKLILATSCFDCRQYWRVQVQV